MKFFFFTERCSDLFFLFQAVLVLNSVIDLITDIGFGIYEFRSADTGF